MIAAFDQNLKSRDFSPGTGQQRITRSRLPKHKAPAEDDCQNGFT